MAKTLTAAASTSLSTRFGTEPIILLRVSWASGVTYYAGKDLAFGSIVALPYLLSMGQITHQQKLDNISAIGTVQFQLDDATSHVKNRIDAAVVEDTPVRIYLHYEGNAEADLITLFDGVIRSQVEWSEGDRIFTANAETQFEGGIFGFVPQVSDYADLHYSAVGKAWPVAYGSPIHVPCVAARLAAVAQMSEDWQTPQSGLSPAMPQDFDVVDSSEFPQATTVDVSINGWIFRGSFNGNTFTVEEENLPKYQALEIEAFPAGDPVAENLRWARLASDTLIVGHHVQISWPDGTQSTNYVVRQRGRNIEFSQIWSRPNALQYQLQPGDTISQVAKTPRVGWENSFFASAEHQQAGILTSNGTVTQATFAFSNGQIIRRWDPGSPDLHVASILSGTIRSVYAWRTVEGRREFVAVPSNLYTKREGTPTIAGLPVTGVTMSVPLTELDQGWESQIFITLTSSIGPNVADIIQHIIETYTSLPVDAASFAAVNTAVANYPAHFAVTSTITAFKLAEQVAWQARCALIVTEGVVKIKYLGTEPASDITVTTAEVIAQSLSLTYTPVNDLVTQFEGMWAPDMVQEKQTLLHRENVDTHGLRRRAFEFFIYNIRSLADKSASFWAHRFANVWRLARMSHTMQIQELEPFDIASLNLSTVIAPAPVKSELRALQLDTVNWVSAMEVWLPSVAGTVTVDANAWQDDSGDTLPSNPALNYNEGSELEFHVPLSLRLVNNDEGSAQLGIGVITSVYDSSTSQSLRDRGDYGCDIYASVGSTRPSQTGVPVRASRGNSSVGLGQANQLFTIGDRVLVFRREGENVAQLDMPTTVRGILVSEGDNLLVIQPFDGTTTGPNLEVAKPPELRRASYDGLTIDGVLYTYINSQARRADFNAVQEEHFVLTPYRIGDTIIATRNSQGSGLSLGNNILYEDMNAAGRGWAYHDTTL